MIQSALFALLILLSALDAWTTVQILRGGGTEQNGPLAALMRAQGVQPALAIIKAALICILLVALATGYLRDWQATAALAAADLFFAAVVIHNLIELKRARSNG